MPHKLFLIYRERGTDTRTGMRHSGYKFVEIDVTFCLQPIEHFLIARFQHVGHFLFDIFCHTIDFLLYFTCKPYSRIVNQLVSILNACKKLARTCKKCAFTCKKWVFICYLSLFYVINTALFHPFVGYIPFLKQSP